MVVTPKIMGKAMGLNPAILLLSLSVWGALLGFLGLIVALPLTTLIIAYWQRYVTKEKPQYHEEMGKNVPISDKMKKSVKIWQNIWLFQIFAVPLHSLLKHKAED